MPRSGTFGICVAGIVLLVACGKPAGQRAQLTHPLVVGVTQLPRLVSPLSINRDAESRTLTGMLYDGLYEPSTIGDTADWIPRLAEAHPAPIDETVTVFDLPLRTDVRWHDGHAFTAFDVAYSWRVLSDPRNEYADRSVLVSLIRSVRALTSRSVRVTFTRPISPVDAARLLGFPIMPARVAGTEAPTLVHPDSALRDPRLARILRQPVGTGAFELLGQLEDSGTTLFFRSRDSTRGIVWRLLADSVARRTAVRAGEVDVLLDADTSSLQRWPHGARPLFSTRETQLALVLNPNAATLRSGERRKRVGELLRADSVQAGCATNAGRLPAASFRVIVMDGSAAAWRVQSRLREIVHCLKSRLAIVTRRGAAVPFASASIDAALVRFGDESDVAPILDGLRAAPGNLVPRLRSLDDRWRTATRYASRDSLHAEILRSLDEEGMLVPLLTQRSMILVGQGVSGLGFTSDRGLTGARDWRWQP